MINIKHAALNKVMMEVPVQSDVSQYEKLLGEKIESKRIIRWYIARMLDGKAMVEAVYDDSPTVYFPISKKEN